MLTNVAAKTIDNSLEGTPTVSCGPENIEIHGTTRDDFEGVLFIKNWRRTRGCYNHYEKFGNSTKDPIYSIPLKDMAKCGLELRRNPDSRELEIFAVFIFSFHPNFVTMSDRAFAVHCIFQQQMLTVATKFNFISDLTTRAILDGTATMIKPNLKVLNGRVPDVSLDAATRVYVGDPVIFVWTLKEKSEIYGVRVLDCVAETMDGRKMKIIEDGCSTDDIIITNVQYAENNQKAFADAMAFKFPDAEDVWIKCNIQMCLQRHEHLQILATGENHICPKESVCTKRRKRSVEELTQSRLELGDEDVMVVNNKLQVIDVYAPGTNQTALPLIGDEPITDEIGFKSAICMTQLYFSAAAAFLATIYLSTIICSCIFAYFFYKSSKPNSNW